MTKYYQKFEGSLAMKEKQIGEVESSSKLLKITTANVNAVCDELFTNNELPVFNNISYYFEPRGANKLKTLLAIWKSDNNDAIKLWRTENKKSSKTSTYIVEYWVNIFCCCITEFSAPNLSRGSLNDIALLLSNGLLRNLNLPSDSIAEIERTVTILNKLIAVSDEVEHD